MGLQQKTGELQMKYLQILRFAVAIFVWFFSSIAGAQLFGSAPQLENLEQFNDGRLQFQSVRAVDWSKVVGEGRQFVNRAEKVWVPARLYLPKNTSAKVPAVVIEHGIGGLYYRDGRIRPYVEYAELLADAGVAALVVDTHGGRGIGAARQLESSQVSVYTFIADVFAGADMLRSHPKIDGDRIGVMGFSKGGSTALLAVDKRFVDAFSKKRDPFAFHLGVYPGCQTFPENLRSTGAPVYFLLGEKDNYTGTSGCYEIEKKLKSAGNPTRITVYPGAFHSWDEDSKPFRVEDVSTADCRWVLKDGGGVWGGGMTKPIGSFIEGEAYFRGCVKRDEIYVGRVESAYRAGRKDVVDIAISVLRSGK